MCCFCSWMVKHMITLVQVGLCGIWKMGCFPWNQAVQQDRNLHHCIFTTLHYLLNLDKFPLLRKSKAIKPLCTSTRTIPHPTLFLFGMRWVDWYFVCMQKISFMNVSWYIHDTSTLVQFLWWLLSTHCKDKRRSCIFSSTSTLERTSGCVFSAL